MVPRSYKNGDRYRILMSKSGTCCICGLAGKLTSEHLPAASAFNESTVTAHTLEDWLDRDESGQLKGGVQQQRGS